MEREHEVGRGSCPAEDSLHSISRKVLGRMGNTGGAVWGHLLGNELKNPPANVGDIRDASFIPRSGRSHGGWHSHPLQYSCLENPHGKRSLVGYRPWGLKESDTTERLSTEQNNRDQIYSPALNKQNSSQMDWAPGSRTPWFLRQGYFFHKASQHFITILNDTPIYFLNYLWSLSPH